MPPFDPFSAVRDITLKSKSNFGISFLFLPKEKREAMYALYSFCRHIDDLADQQALHSFQQLEWWQQEIKKMTSEPPRHPISRALVVINQRFQIPITYYLDLLKGVEMDLYKNRYQNFDELYDYCFYVASVVGLITLKIFGTKQQESEQYAINLGIALQLTNILRDLNEDLERGRIYLPQEDLHRFHYSERDLHHRTYNQNFLDLMKFQTERAKEFYRKAEGLAMNADWKNLAPAHIMGNIYFALLKEIEDADFAVFEQRISLSRPKRVRIALSTFLKNRYLAWSGFSK